MRVFLQELRKLFRPFPMLAALAVLLEFGQGPIHHYLYTLPKESETGEVLAIYTGWREQYGTTLDPDELPGIQKQLEELYAEADNTIAHWDETKWAQWSSFSDMGITNYEEYIAFLHRTDRDANSLSENNVAALLLDSRTNFLQMRINAVENFLEQYDFETKSGQAAIQPDGGAANGKERARCEEIAANPEITHSLLYAAHLSSAQEFAVQVALMMLLAVSVVVSPYLVREKLCLMTQMQWTTRTGRKLAYYQLAAVLAFSALFSAAMTVLFGTCYCIRWNAFLFRDCIAYAAGGSQIPWFNLTYGQYLCILGVMMVGLGIACGAVMFFLSRFSGHYISMLFKAVPAFLAFALLADKTIAYALFFGNDLSLLSRLPGVEPLLVTLVLVVSLLLVCLSAHCDQSRPLAE